MVTTDLDTLDAAIRRMLVNLSPLYQRQGDCGWTAHTRRAPPAFTRRFDLQWQLRGRTRRGIFTHVASDTTALLHIITDYNVDHAIADRMIESDHWQIRDELRKLKGSQSGLIHTDSAGVSHRAGDTDNDTIQVDHDFHVRYLLALQS